MLLTRTTTGLVLAVHVVMLPAASADKPVRVYILSGQSNMEASLTPTDHGQTSVFFFSATFRF